MTVNQRSRQPQDSQWTDVGYEGGHACHTGQFFFDEESVLASAEVEPYASNAAERTTLDEDTIYDGSGTPGGLLKPRYDKKNTARGSPSLSGGCGPAPQARQAETTSRALHTSSTPASDMGPVVPERDTTARPVEPGAKPGTWAAPVCRAARS